MAVLATVLGLLLMFTPQTNTVEAMQFKDMGHIQYDSALFERPNVDRLYGVTEFVLNYIEARCVPECLLEPSMLDVDLRIVPYAQFEDFLLAQLDARFPQLAEKIRGDGALIDGHTLSRFDGSATMYFYQEPSDTLYIHELLHYVFPSDEEIITYQRQMEIIASREYKDWLRNNY
jgi:hypothetical protein